MRSSIVTVSPASGNAKYPPETGYPVFEDGKQFTVEHALHESPVGFVLAFKHLHVYLALRPRRSVERRHRLAQYADQDLLNAGHAQPVIDRPVPGTFIVFVLDVAFFRNHRPP